MERAWKINNYYELLGIPEDISKTKSETEIEKIIYKRRRLLTQIYHPDGFQTESDRRKYDELFKFINLAVETLIDRAKRNKYDESMRETKDSENHNSSNLLNDDFDIEDHLSEYQGHKILVLNNEYPRFQFGLTKANLILVNIELIKRFVEIYGD